MLEDSACGPGCGVDLIIFARYFLHACCILTFSSCYWARQMHACVYKSCRELTCAVVSQANSEVSALLGRIPSAVGYQPTLATDLGTLQERITSTHKGSITSVQVSRSFACHSKSRNTSEKLSGSSLGKHCKRVALLSAVQVVGCRALAAHIGAAHLLKIPCCFIIILAALTVARQTLVGRRLLPLPCCAGHLRAGRRSDGPCTRHHLRTSGRHHGAALTRF